MNWRDDAACVGIGDALFFPEKYSGDNGHDAKKVCRRCPVREQCLITAIENREKYGIFGGFAPTTRARITRETAATAIAADEEKWDVQAARAQFRRATAQELRDAHMAYTWRKDRSPEAIAGERAYQAAVKRNKRKDAAA